MTMTTTNTTLKQIARNARLRREILVQLLLSHKPTLVLGAVLATKGGAEALAWMA